MARMWTGSKSGIITAIEVKDSLTSILRRDPTKEPNAMYDLDMLVLFVNANPELKETRCELDDAITNWKYAEDGDPDCDKTFVEQLKAVQEGLSC